MIDLRYRQDCGRRREVIVSDTGSYSDVVFGLLRLLGFDYRPQLADLAGADNLIHPGRSHLDHRGVPTPILAASS